MATGDKLVTLDGLKAAYDAGVQYRKQDLNVSNYFSVDAIIQNDQTIRASTTYKCTGMILVKKGDVLHFKLRAQNPVIVYASDGTTVADMVIRPSGTWMESTYTFFENEADGYTGYFRACTYAAGISDAYAYVAGYMPDLIKKELADANTAVTGLGDRMTSAESSLSSLSDEIDERAPALVLGKNKFYGIDVQSGRMESADGSLVGTGSTSTNMTTDYIDVTGYTKGVCFSPRVKAWAEYLEDKTPNTDADGSGFHSYSTANSDTVIHPHANTKYVRISFYRADLNFLQLEDNTFCTSYEAPAKAQANTIGLNDTQSAAVMDSVYNPLYGKKWAFIGDSFTAGDYTNNASGATRFIPDGKYAGKNYTYPWLIAARNSMIGVSCAYNGMALATNKANSFMKPDNATNYTQIPDDADFITIYLGINDTAGVGTIDSTDTTTFYGAYNTLMAYILEHCPFAHVGIIVSNGCGNMDYPNASKAIAEKWGVPYIDLNGDERTPAMIRTANPNVSDAVKAKLLEVMSVNPTEQTIDGTTYLVNNHPNAKAHEFEAHFIEQFLKTL